jgi:hypothetical protein
MSSSAELDPDTRRDADHGRDAEGSEIQVRTPAQADAEVAIGERAGQLRAVSMDMTGGYAKSVRRHAPQAVICIDNYHVVQLATKALDEVRREHWNELRRAGDRDAAKQFKDSRWSLLKNPEDLTDRQADTRTELHAAGGKIPRAWAMKEMVRAIFAAGLTVGTVDELIDRLWAACRAAASNRSCGSDARSVRQRRARPDPSDLRPDHTDSPARADRMASPTITPGEPEVVGIDLRRPALAMPFAPGFLNSPTSSFFIGVDADRRLRGRDRSADLLIEVRNSLGTVRNPAG